MPKYLFRFSGDREPDATDLPDDDAAWSELISLVGSTLKDIDGHMPDHARVEVELLQDDRGVGSVKVFAVREERRRRSAADGQRPSGQEQR